MLALDCVGLQGFLPLIDSDRAMIVRPRRCDVALHVNIIVSKLQILHPAGSFTLCRHNAELSLVRKGWRRSNPDILCVCLLIWLNNSMIDRNCPLLYPPSVCC